MSEILLGLNIQTLKFIMVWPPEGRTNPTLRLKRLCLLAIVTTSLFTILSGIIRAAFTEADGYHALIQRFIILIDCIMCFFITYCFSRKIENIKNLIQQLYSFTQYCPRERILATEKKVRFYTKGIMVYCAFGTTINVLSPLIGRTGCEERRVSELYRQRDPCGLLARTFFLFDASGKLFPLVLVHQSCSSIIVTSYVVLITMTLIGVLMHLIAQIRHCRKLIRELNPKNIHKRFKSIIEYHIKIIEFSDDVNSAFGEMLMSHLTVTSLVISCLIFEMLMVADIQDSIRFAIHLWGWLLLLLLICFFGQILINEDIYGITWFEMPVGLRRMLYLMILRAQRPLTLSAANLGEMSLSTFLRVISSAYSYFTMLLNFKA